MSLHINDVAPDFAAETTEGPIRFHEWIGESWAVLFSHPKDCTPVYSTELDYMVQIKPEFDKRNVKIIGLSVGTLEDHGRWASDIAMRQGTAPNYPIIADAELTVSKLYHMLPASASGDPDSRTAADNQTVPNVFVIGPDKKIKLILIYPTTAWRNFDELLRVLDSLQFLVLAHRRAEEASQAKSTFLANMSHELRTPLNAILGFSEIIRDKSFGKDEDRYADYAGDIHRSGAHLLNIVNDVLDVSKIEAGKLELREEEIEVHTAIQECLLAVEAQAAYGGIYLAKLPPDIGASFFGDKTKLKQIIMNLLSNAIKFTPPGASVGINAVADEDGGMTLVIRDDGIGMSREEIQVALELFRQVDNSLSRRFEGTGLGLPLAVRLTELHGGTLSIESTLGKGTAVMVRFPAYRITWKGAR